MIDGGLDPVTARAVQLLAAADTVAATNRVHKKTPRRWREPSIWIMGLAFACLLMLAASYAQLSFVARGNHVLLHEQTTADRRLVDCTTPTGRCYQRGQQQTAGAVQQLVVRLSVGMCRIVYPHATTAAIERCVTRITKEK